MIHRTAVVHQAPTRPSLTRKLTWLPYLVAKIRGYIYLTYKSLENAQDGMGGYYRRGPTKPCSGGVRIAFYSWLDMWPIHTLKPQT